jgi:perosamine synthetase
MEVRDVPFQALGGLFEADDVAAANAVNLAAAEPGGSFFPLPEEPDFQARLAAHEGAAHAVAVNSCGTALDACMMVLGIGPGDEVITTPLTFVCSATCAAAQGARVVFADIDPDTLCLDPAKVREKMTPRTKAIIPVHFGGHACDIAGFDAITAETGVPVIYDAAHAVGTTYEGQPVGGAGKASCYSFQSNKNITTLGEGGAVTTDDAEFAEQVRQKKTFGYVYGGPSLRVASIGFNYRMTKPQLAVGLTQLAKADRVIGAKLAKMQALQQQLENVDGLRLPGGIAPGHGAHLYVLRVPGVDRATVASHLKEHYKVGTAWHYPLVWSWEAMADVDADCPGCPEAEAAAGEVVTMPVFADTSDDTIDYLAWATRQTVEAVR